ncbi:MAG TPA: hypothetical protein ENN99_16340 [Chloroflexi bacterium]|nr:hypothetical protein [Chloroflexota bacterium]
MKEQVSSSWLVADFFTYRHRLSGRVNVRQKKLASQLNNTSSSFLELEDAYISNVDHPADILASYATSILRKDSITAVALARQEDGLLREQTYGSYFGTYLRRVFITVPSFEIEGYLRLSGKLDLRTVLTTGTDAFIPILDGQMRSSVRPDFVFTGGVILINKAHVGVLCIEEEE